MTKENFVIRKRDHNTFYYPKDRKTLRELTDMGLYDNDYEISIFCNKLFGEKFVVSYDEFIKYNQSFFIDILHGVEVDNIILDLMELSDMRQEDIENMA